MLHAFPKPSKTERELFRSHINPETDPSTNRKPPPSRRRYAL